MRNAREFAVIDVTTIPGAWVRGAFEHGFAVPGGLGNARDVAAAVGATMTRVASVR